MPSEVTEGRIIQSVFKTLFKHYGRQNWWPGETPFEVAIGAILVQRTAWRNAAKALSNLRERNLIDPSKMALIPRDDLTKIIFPSGLADQKAKRVITFSKTLLENYDASIEELLHRDNARQILLSVEGIGNETADSILLFAGDRPFLPIGEYTKRTLMRIGLKDRSYDEWQKTAMKVLPRRVDVYKEFHALFVAHGKQLCKKKPLCNSCPLRGTCKYSSTQRP